MKSLHFPLGHIILTLLCCFLCLTACVFCWVWAQGDFRCRTHHLCIVAWVIPMWTDLLATLLTCEGSSPKTYSLWLSQILKQEVLKSGAFPELGRNLAFGLMNDSFVSSKLWVYWQGTRLCLAAVFPLLRSIRLLSTSRVLYQSGYTIFQCLSLLLMSKFNEQAIYFCMTLCCATKTCAALLCVHTRQQHALKLVFLPTFASSQSFYRQTSVARHRPWDLYP